MEIFFWITDLLVPVSMIFIGLLCIISPPKKINNYHGYRTSTSMSSKAAWDYAHFLCGRIFTVLGILLLILIIVNKLIIPINASYLSLINVSIELLALIIPIPFIEHKLKSKFHK